MRFAKIGNEITTIEKIIKENQKMREALRIIRDSFWTEPSESKKHLELQDIAKNTLKEIEDVD